MRLSCDGCSSARPFRSSPTVCRRLALLRTSIWLLVVQVALEAVRLRIAQHHCNAGGTEGQGVWAGQAQHCTWLERARSVALGRAPKRAKLPT